MDVVYRTIMPTVFRTQMSSTSGVDEFVHGYLDGWKVREWKDFHNNLELVSFYCRGSIFEAVFELTATEEEMSLIRILHSTRFAGDQIIFDETRSVQRIKMRLV